MILAEPLGEMGLSRRGQGPLTLGSSRMLKVSTRAMLLAFASAGVLMASPALAQDQTSGANPAQTDGDQGTGLGELVVTGSRAPARSQLETVSPVDVITADTLTTRSTGTELAAIHLPLVHFFRLRLSAELMQRLTRGGCAVTSTQGSSDPELFRRLTDYMNGEDAARRTYAIEELLMRINRLNFEPHRVIDGGGETETSSEPLDASAFRNIIEICAYVTENFRDDIGSAEIASSLDIHPKYAMSVFKKSTGMTLNEYLTLMRLSYAQSLLLQDDANILDIALDSGFGSLSTFSQAFRKITGQSPSDFRRQRDRYLLAV
ncbi:MAG: helix-turn-helix domain-containing protein [Alphaproteobacteria bacterium]|nr:MAG: helix-turn-helix domain-containing protein [Alphaproteobacteria bacterium]